MWSYSQSTGELRFPSKMGNELQTLAKGYSGQGIGKNNPDAQHIRAVGPIPRGQWRMSNDPGNVLGEYIIRLTPLPGTVVHGRGGFLIHGDSVSSPGNASHGCIILPKHVRRVLWNLGDEERILEVTR